MSINFPHNPNPNDIHPEPSLGKSWIWDGITWKIYSSTTTGIAFGDLSVVTEAAQGGGSLTYNPANGQFTFKPAAGSGGGATNFTGLGDTPSSLTAGKWLKVNTGGTALEWTDAPSDNNTTYDLTASDGSVATEEKIILSGSDSSEDAVTLAVSGSLTIARSNNTITFGGGGGSNTTYDLAASADSGNAKVTLSGSDSTNDDVTFSAGGGITYAVTGNTVQISSANSLGGLTDTNIAGSPTDNYVLTYDAGASTWEPQPAPSGLTIANNSNNRIVTGMGGSGLHAEGNLTFDSDTSTLAVTGSATISDDLTITGNLTVSGTTTTVNTATLNIADNLITLNSDFIASSPTEDAGIEVKRGNAPSTKILWNETTDKWQFTNDGTNYSDIGSSGGEANVQVDWNQTTTSADDYIKNKPTIPAAQVQTDWNATTGLGVLLNKPTLFSGSYNDLSNKPTLFSGNYNDLSNKPTIPAAQIQSDWNQSNSSSLDFIKNKNGKSFKYFINL
mgnify:CR=1 FL=1